MWNWLVVGLCQTKRASAGKARSLHEDDETASRSVWGGIHGTASFHIKPLADITRGTALNNSGLAADVGAVDTIDLISELASEYGHLLRDGWVYRWTYDERWFPALVELAERDGLPIRRDWDRVGGGQFFPEVAVLIRPDGSSYRFARADGEAQREMSTDWGETLQNARRRAAL
jgi:hypothetical protein